MMGRFIGVLWLCMAAAPAWAGSAPTVQVKSGTLRGVALSGGGAAFKGIPYAAAPTGARRWRSPEPPPAWKGMRDASQFGAACPQPAQGWNNSLLSNASEDCLYLNVWTAKLAAPAHLPVMVWIHGGAFVGGAGTDPMFAGEALATQGVVVVTLNYRLGIFGFLAHPELSRESARKTSGNFALQDQIAALQWVRDNIAQFGGDPRAITVFGQSAGGMSVISLMTSPLTKDGFQRAVVESGAILGGPPMNSLSQAEAMGTEFAGSDSVAALRALPADALLQRLGAFAAAHPGARPGPIVDGYVLTEDPMAVFAEHQEHRLPLIIGNNAREGFGRPNDAGLPGMIQGFYGEQAPAALALYGTEDPVLGSPAAQWLTDTTFRCASVMTAARHAAQGSPVYSYHFEQSLPGREAEGAAHTYELPYVFGNLLSDGPLGAPFGPADRQLSNTMVTYWTNFAKHGDPNGPGVPPWPRFEPGDAAYLRLSSALPGGAAAAQGLRQGQCALFAKKIEQPTVPR
jgi:para-nitrobenzyl esterase